MQIPESVKPMVEGFLARGGPARIARALGSCRDAVLAFHDVVPDDLRAGGDSALHLSWSSFRSLVDVLEKECEVVPLERIVEGPVPEGRRSRVAITFDDAYRGALRLALPDLSDRGLPATVFVSPGLLGAGATWWDGIGTTDGEILRGLTRRVALDRFGGDVRRITGWARRSRLALRSVHSMACPGPLSELDRVARLPGVSLGAHGWWHLNFTSICPTRLEDELRRPRRWLWERYGVPDPLLSYPYGSFSPAVAAAAARAGYRAAFGCGGGRIPERAADPMSLPRVSVPAGLSADGLRLRLSGILER